MWRRALRGSAVACSTLPTCCYNAKRGATTITTIKQCGSPCALGRRMSVSTLQGSLRHCSINSASSSSVATTTTASLDEDRAAAEERHDRGNEDDSDQTTTMMADGLQTLQYRIPLTQPIGCPRTAESLAKLQSFPIERIRNFSIIAHIDHGKTTLSDAILRRTGVLRDGGAVGNYMDKLAVEKERGITIKAQTCSMFVKNEKDGEEYLLNLIDTPGHVDFQYEVSRSLGASEGAVLLVDASQGIEAQTMANLYLALDANLMIVPGLTKLDTVLGDEKVDSALQQIEDTTGLLRQEVVLTSARRKLGVEAVLYAVMERVPPPKGKTSPPDALAALRAAHYMAGAPLPPHTVPLRALLFDCWPRRDDKQGLEGIMCLVRVIDGELSTKTIAQFYHSKKRYPVKEVGIMHPEPCPVQSLSAGMVGYLFIAGVTRADVSVGDTIFSGSQAVEPIPGFKMMKPVVFAGFFPNEGEQVTQLKEAVDRLRVTDPSVTLSMLDCPALGPGLQLGFLGMLHMKVFQERLFAEFQQRVLMTPAQVQYQYVDHAGKVHDLTVYNWKWQHEGAAKYLEPIVRATIVTPMEHFAAINGEALSSFRAEQIDMKPVDATRVSVRYRMPLSELARGFFDRVKSLSHGYAALEYDDAEYEEADLVKLEIVINKAKISALSTICPRQDAPKIGRRIVMTLKEHVERSSVDLPLQAYVSSKCVARETIGAYKKDVLAKIHAGDPSRKMKKLADQKKGKERLARRSVGTVQLDQDVLAAAMGATSHNH